MVFATVPDYFTRIVTSFYRRAFKAYLVVHRKHDQTSMTSVSISSFVCVVFHGYSLVNASWCVEYLLSMCFINPQVSSQHYWDGVCMYSRFTQLYVCICHAVVYFCFVVVSVVGFNVCNGSRILVIGVNINALFRGWSNKGFEKVYSMGCLFSMHGYL